MPISIYNPPCPHADPVRAGLQQNGQHCGRCICVPRWWEIISTAPEGADDVAQAMFNGPIVLPRDLTTFHTDVNAQCQWTFQLDLTGVLGGGVGTWLLYWGSIGSGPSVTGWILRADNNTGDPSTSATAAWLIPDAGIVEGVDGGYFNCLSPNTFNFLIPSPVSVGFNTPPASITIKPFWP